VTSVVLADDQDLVRSGLRALLEAREIDVRADVANGREVVTAAREHRPDVLVMDIRMPVMDGIAATREITASSLPTRVLVLTTYDLRNASARRPWSRTTGRPAFSASTATR
jgi:DNA-binding NarL/FixJ family response regulator